MSNFCHTNTSQVILPVPHYWGTMPADLHPPPPQSSTTTSRTSTVAAPAQRGTTQNRNQNHKRSTRSQVALPSFSVDYDRSPLKHARDAVRRANVRFSPSPSPVESDSHKDENGGGSGSGKGGADTKMADILARVGTETTLFAHTERGDDVHGQEDKEEVVMDDAEENDQPVEDAESTRDPFDFNSDHPKHPKRARSASFDDVPPPSFSETNSRPDGVAPSASSQPPPTEIDTVAQFKTQPSASTPDTNPPANGASNSKRAKVSKQNTLHAFFARTPNPPSSSSSSATQKPVLPNSTTPRRIFSEASTSTPPPPSQGIRNKVGEIPATPTIQQLRAIPTLDLRTLTPSPRKRALGLGHGAPGAASASASGNEARSPMKGREVSSGAALLVDRSEDAGGDAGHGQPSCVEKTDEKRATSVCVS